MRNVDLQITHSQPACMCSKLEHFVTSGISNVVLLGLMILISELVLSVSDKNILIVFLFRVTPSDRIIRLALTIQKHFPRSTHFFYQTDVKWFPSSPA
jgi:hypothetical protein